MPSRCHNQMHLIDNHRLFKDGQVFHSRNHPLRGNSCCCYVLFYKDHCKSYHFGSILIFLNIGSDIYAELELLRECNNLCDFIDVAACTKFEVDVFEELNEIFKIVKKEESAPHMRINAKNFISRCTVLNYVPQYKDQFFICPFLSMIEIVSTACIFCIW